MRLDRRIGVFAAIVACLVSTPRVFGQNAGNQLPNPRLFTVSPPGGQVGKTLEVTFSGSDVEDPQALLFSHPSIKATPILPPPPPKPDPKKPAPPPMPPPQITKFKVIIGPDAPVGLHDVRLVNKWGISNARAFLVGDLPEVEEKEPNNEAEQAQRIELNTTVNATIAASTDVDYYVFPGKQGQRVIVSCLCSTIDSRAQVGLGLYDRAGRQLAVNRRYQGNDALVDCTLPTNGDYVVRVHDFTYSQGSPEHFYRLTVSTAPWIDAVYPPMVEPGKPAQVTVYGRNLPGGQVDPNSLVDGRALEKIIVTINAPAVPDAGKRPVYSGPVYPTTAGLDGFEYRIKNSVGTSNPFFLTFARAPVVLDNEKNDTPETAQEVAVPCEIAGRIEKKKDRDWYSFTAKAGAVYSIELYSERLGLPTDMMYVLRNPATKQDIGEFDDNAENLSPLKFVTQTNDPPRYRFVAPADGKYQIKVTSHDGDMQGSPRQLYRLSILPEQPDFRLVVMAPEEDRPDAARLLQKGQQFFSVYAYRTDGFTGTISLSAEGLPAGVTCPPQTIGTGMLSGTLVLSAAPNATAGHYEIKVKGTATINGKPVVREARPAGITWPIGPGSGVPAAARLDRALYLSVRDQAPYSLLASLPMASIRQAEKINLALKLTRFWPEANTPLQIQPVNIPPNLTINNNQPITINQGQTDGKMEIVTNDQTLPGMYTIGLRTTTQIPYNKDPKGQKQPVNVVSPATPVVLTVLPKQVATLAIPNPNVTAKPGSKTDFVVQFNRLYDFDGEFKVQLVLPANVKGVSADDVTVPAGKNEAKLILKVAPDAPVGNRSDLVVRATAMVNGNVPTVHEAKFNVNVAK